MTDNRHIGLSVKTDQWFTPPEILKRVHDTLGTIHLDPCGSAESNQVVRANQYISSESIDTCWGYPGSVYCNPPSGKYNGYEVRGVRKMNPEYRGLSNPQAFFKKLNQMYDNGHLTTYIFLGYSIEQMQTLQSKQSIPRDCLFCVPSKRIRFVDQSGNRNSPTHGNCLIYRGPNPQRFISGFSDLGMILGVHS
jgi:hypothetical protein